MNIGEPGKLEVLYKVTCCICGETEIFDIPTYNEVIAVLDANKWIRVTHGWAHQPCVVQQAEQARVKSSSSDTETT